jgi:hypothetical protein
LTYLARSRGGRGETMMNSDDITYEIVSAAVERMAGLWNRLLMDVA